MAKSIYYSLLLLGLVASTLFIPTYLSENAELQWVNSQLSALEGQRDPSDPEVKSILDRGTIVFQEAFAKYVSIVSLFVCVAAIGLTLVLKISGTYDPLYVLAFFSVLLLAGALNPVSYAVITAFCVVAFFWKKRRSRS